MSRGAGVAGAVRHRHRLWAEHAFPNARTMPRALSSARFSTRSRYRVLRDERAPGRLSVAATEGRFGTASILQDGRVVFDIAGNKYRIVVWINYTYRVVYVRFIGTHKQYDDIDPQTI